MRLGRTVFVTRREAELEQRSAVESGLFVLHSVQLRWEGQPVGIAESSCRGNPKMKTLKTVA